MISLIYHISIILSREFIRCRIFLHARIVSNSAFSFSELGNRCMRFAGSEPFSIIPAWHAIRLSAGEFAFQKPGSLPIFDYLPGLETLLASSIPKVIQ